MAASVTRRTVLGAATSLAGLAASSLCGLASPRAPFEDASGLNEDEITLTIAMLDSHWGAMEELVKAYADTRGIEIEAEPLSYDELYSELNIALTQQAPTYDIVSLEDPWIPQFASFLTPLDASSELTEALVPGCASLGRYPMDAIPCAIPWLGDTQFFVVRPEWLDRAEVPAPATWDETVAVAGELTATLDPESERYAFALSTLIGNDLVRSFLPILQGYGKSIIDPETSVPQLDTPEALAAIETYVALTQLSPAESSAPGEPSNTGRFESGQVAMMSNFWSSDLLASRLVEQEPGAGPIDASVQPAQAGIARQTMTGVWLLGIPLGSAIPEEAWMFLQWLAGGEAQRRLPQLALPPVRIDVYADTELVADLPMLPRLLELLESATPRPRTPFYPQLEQLLAGELGNVHSKDKSGTQALKDANVAIRQFLVREGMLDA